jgi:hypothetical protein
MRRVAVVLALVALAAAATAAADGDPASDFLIQQDVFLPYPPPSAASEHALDVAMARVAARGDRVKVAVIASRRDLGAVPSLFGHPQQYASFLATEIAFAYRGPLLVVMPSGLGFAGGSPAALSSVRVEGPGRTALTQAAAAAVAALERAGALHYRDTRRPSTLVRAQHASAGSPAALRYQAWDDSGRARVRIVVESRGGAVLAAILVPLRRVRQGTWYTAAWRTPRRGTFTVCATATDRAGNRGKPSCAKLTVA